jgi:hypothetical protein
MPSTRPPSRNRISDSAHRPARTPNFISPADLVMIPRKPSANAGASVANSGKIKARRS